MLIVRLLFESSLAIALMGYFGGKQMIAMIFFFFSTKGQPFHLEAKKKKTSGNLTCS